MEILLDLGCEDDYKNWASEWFICHFYYCWANHKEPEFMKLTPRIIVTYLSSQPPTPLHSKFKEALFSEKQKSNSEDSEDSKILGIAILQLHYKKTLVM